MLLNSYQYLLKNLKIAKFIKYNISLLTKMVYPIGKRIFFPIVKLLWLEKIVGLSNLPQEPFVFACNHASFIDDVIVPVMVCKSINKYIHIYCNDTFLKNPLTQIYLEWGKVIPIRVYKSKDQKKINEKAVNLALEYLKKNEPVGLFPEGHRSKDGKLQKAYNGVASLALKAKVTVVPIGTTGTYEIWPKGKKLPNFNKCTINIGKPIHLDQYYGKEKNKKVLKEVTSLIMKEIAKLSKQKYNF